MSEATVDNLKTMLGDALTGVADETLSFYLSQASVIVKNEGVAVNHYKFSILQLYKTAHLLFTNGFILGDVQSESVSDVSVSYGGVSAGDVSGLYTSKWERMYHQVKVTIDGLACRIL
jgi:hypothetical protein